MNPHQVPFPKGYCCPYGPAYPLNPPPGGGWQPQPPPPRHPGYRITPAPLPRPPAISPPFDVYGHARLDYYAPPKHYEPPEAQHIDQNEAGPSTASRGRDHLNGLGSAMDGLQVGEPSPRIRVVSSSSVGSSSSPNRDKPLPNLPRPPLPPITNASDPSLSLSASQSERSDHRASSLPPHVGLAEAPSPSSQHDVYRRTHIQTQSHKSSPPKMFRPSSLLFPPSPPTIPQPHSDPILSHQATAQTQTPTHHGTPTKGQHRPATSVIDLTTGSDSDPSSPTSLRVTPRSAARRRRATSEQPSSHLPNPASRSSPSKSPSPASPNKSVRCAGFTRTGQPCKRLVRASAPYLAALEPNTLPASFELGEEADPVGLGRYCKDHAGMICRPTGFYSKERRGLWLDFDDWISAELEQQTQALLRMIMESKLTAKESAGFLYAYELRDLQTPTTCFFKVGRTDNVPRRIGQWTNRCHSHTPTLRDIFPLPLSWAKTATHPHSTIPHSSTHASLLPGAVQHGTLTTSDPNPAVKRWERLVHLELSDISFSARPREYALLREKCEDCGTGHREIFALPREVAAGRSEQGEGAYQVVVEVVQRWERFVRKVCAG